MKSLFALSAMIAVAGICSTSHAAITYNTQARSVASYADPGQFFTPAIPLTTNVITAPDFGSFDQISQVVVGGPVPNPSATGRAEQHSTLTSTGVTFSGALFSQDGNSTGGVGRAAAQSKLEINFTLDVESPFTLNFTESVPPIGAGTYELVYRITLSSASPGDIVSYVSSIGGSASGSPTYSTAGTIGPGTFTLLIDTYSIVGPTSSSTASTTYSAAFTVPSAPAAACLVLPGFAALRRRRRVN